jgi:hypothetical protein
MTITNDTFWLRILNLVQKTNLLECKHSQGNDNQLVKKFWAFMESKGSAACLWRHHHWPYCDPAESSHNSQTPFWNHYMGHSASQPKIQQCGKWGVYVWKHMACTCKYYHQIGVYVQERTCILHANSIALAISFWNVWHNVAHITTSGDASGVCCLPHHWQWTVSTSETTLVVNECVWVVCVVLFLIFTLNVTIKPWYKRRIVHLPLTSGSSVHMPQLMVTFTTTCHMLSNV